MIVIDSNIWIFAENISADEHGPAAKKVHEVVDSTSYGINTVIVSEVFHALSRLLGAEDAGRRTRNIIEHPTAQWIEFSASAVKEAIDLSVQKKLRINDALIAQQALELKAPVLTDNVKDFRKVKGLKVMKLR